ncbi:type II 3-dehydroquinate dehydratase [Roseobacter sp. N2S]|uniref:type II 3-dehydroquinate dehydratase n=1 Tax=Roseobacter sp. N2S TaxID=2663844 RepID=UPI00285C5CF0|nr:type II 3-dehydroquinate dehydratase [Roseobacter sp. N2S]MDR6265585.1 3-dehydroquinate dehydratase-2 [Roseobacter sp. N2S]
MSKLITVLNGPNLNLLGQRQPEIYGHDTLSDVEAGCAKVAQEYGLRSELLQSNHEGVLVDMIQKCRETSAGIIINPAAYTHTSVAILDALNTFDGPVLEIHISNIHHREAFRHTSFVSKRADSAIIGMGVQGYYLCMHRMGTLLGQSA